MAQTTCSNCGYPWAVAGGRCPNCGHRNSCFISTAVCESLGKDDGCDELKILRNFRDQFVALMPDGKAEIEHYYKISPLILAEINCRDNRVEILHGINDMYLKKAIDSISLGDKQNAYEIYKRMVGELENQYRRK